MSNTNFLIRAAANVLVWFLVFTWWYGTELAKASEARAPESRSNASELPTWEAISNKWSSIPIVRLRNAAEQGDVQAQYYLGRLLIETNKNTAVAVRWIQKAADAGLAEAQNRLGWMFNTGTSVPQNPQTAMEWFTRSAKQGYAKAQLNIGMNYADGLGVRQDYAEAAKWYRLAAEQGHPTAQNKLGWLYEEGKGVPKDRKEALFWIRKAAEQNFGPALMSMGWINEYYDAAPGRAVTGNYVEAAEWYEKAAQQGIDEAAAHLAVMCLYGKLGDNRRAEAQKWIKLASTNEYLLRYGILPAPAEGEETKHLLSYAERGNLEAQWKVASLYNKGDEKTSANPAEAFKWFNRILENDSSSTRQGEAALQVAIMYATGRGAAQDNLKALQYFRALTDVDSKGNRYLFAKQDDVDYARTSVG